MEEGHTFCEVVGGGAQDFSNPKRTASITIQDFLKKKEGLLGLQ